jgi:hypothetical protein
MLQTIEAIIEPSGTIRLLEEFHVSSPRRAIVTVLDTPALSNTESARGSAAAILQFFREHPLPIQGRRSVEEIDAGIEAERQAWD